MASAWPAETWASARFGLSFSACELACCASSKSRGCRPPAKKIHVSVSQPCPGGGKLRINLNRSREHLPGKLDVLTRPSVKKLPAPKIKFVRFDLRRGR